MSTQRIFSSRTKVALSNYVGHKGMLFFDEVSGLLRIGDGVTPGGNPIGIDAVNIVTDTLTPGIDNVYGIGTELLRWNHIHLGDGGIYFDGYQTSNAQTVPYIPGSISQDLIPAVTNNSLHLGSSTHRWGDVYIGKASLNMQDEITGANVAFTVNSGTLYLNGAANLAIGNLVIRDTTLQSLTTNLDISIGETNDTGFFYIKRKAQFDNVSFSSTEPMVSFNASGGAEPTTIFPDTVIQTVGRPNKNSRIVQRSYGSTSTVGGSNTYAVWASYAARGTVASPQPLKQNDILMRVSGNGYGTSTWGSGGARIEYVALEDFTDAAKGTKINFWTTPAGQLSSQNVASINSVGIVAAGIEFSATGRVQTDAGIPITAKAISSATYVATLGIDGKLDTSQIPSSLSGAVVFKGGWDANANSPSLVNGSSTDGWEYAITTSGTRSLGTQTGSVSYQAGGFVIYGNGIWNYTPPVSNFTYAIATANTHIKINGNQSTQETGVLTFTTDATPNSTTATIVSRDASGNFAANVITANLTGNVTGAVSGNAGSVTNGVYTTGSQSIDGVKTFTSVIQGTITTATFATSFNTSTLVANAVNAQVATTTTNFNTSTLVANAVNAQVATTTTNFNTSTLVANAVNATTATTAKTATTATNLAVATTLFAGKLSSATGSVPKNSVATVTYTVTGLTTNHKIIITPGTVMPDRAFSVTAAWVSGADTLSIQYANNTGGAISVTLDINYFAFV